MSCPLYLRSVYSLLSSMCSIEDMIYYGKKYGYSSLGLVDRNVLTAAMPFKKACQKANIKPVYGLEFSVLHEERIYDMILYARNDRGFRNLMGLSSHICTNKLDAIDIDTLNEYREDNILCLLSDKMPLTAAIEQRQEIEEQLVVTKTDRGSFVKWENE